MKSACPDCGAQRGHLLGCPQVDPQFLKDARPFTSTAHDSGLEALRSEWWTQLTSTPLALTIAWTLSYFSIGAMLERTFSGMWLHELGHAIASWVCGYAAFPAPWFTYTSHSRSWLVTALVVASGLALVISARLNRKTSVMALGAAVVAMGLFGRSVAPSLAQQFFLFSGDAGAMVLGALLMGLFGASPQSAVVSRGLRWGFLPLGAAAWADATRTWWESKRDFAAMPFGIEDGTLSDPLRLVETYHWDEKVIISRYLTVAAFSLAFVLTKWVWALVSLHLRTQQAKRHSET